jgi:four helix bundle protein
MLHVVQLRKSAQSISANISEGFGRGEGRDRTRILRIARGEAEETIRHLTANYRASRITSAQFWAIRNVLVVIVKMLSALVRNGLTE